MSKDHSPTTRAAEPPRANNLRLITGIGPAVEKRLNGVGIFTFAQLANLSPADIAAALADLIGLSSEHIIKQDWIGQARKLAAESTSSEAQNESEAPIEPPEFIERTHIATHQVESQLTHELAIKEVSSEVQEEVEALADTEKIVTSTTTVEQPTPIEFVPATSLSVESEKSVVPSPIFPNAEEPEHVSAVATESEPLTPITASSRLAGALRVREIALVRAESNNPSRLLPRDEPFDVRLTLDLAELQVPGNSPINYKASIYGKGRGPGSRSGLVGEAQGTVLPANTVTINVKGNTLPEGIYQLAAMVILGLPDMQLTPTPSTLAAIDGGQVQIY